MSTAIWQNYEVDPLDLIGRAVRVTVIKRTSKNSGEGGYYFGVVESIDEPRGRVNLDEEEDWADMLASYFDQSYPNVTIYFRGGMNVRFDPERDAVSIEWNEVSA